MCCGSLCVTSCSGSNCGYCSECTGCAPCSNIFCGSCLTGAPDATACTPQENQTTISMCGSLIPPTETPIGAGVGSCANPDVSLCLPFAGVDSSGNEIYQKTCGGLVYSDGSTATRADITCNCCACKGTMCTPCSPRKCGSTDQPPKGVCGKSPQGGGSGSGSAKSSTGCGAKPHCSGTKQASALSSAMNRFGSAITSLLGGGQKVSTAQVLPGQKAPAKQNAPMSSNTYLLIIVIVGVLLLVMAFGHKPTGD
jgi:hypothetical protein